MNSFGGNPEERKGVAGGLTSQQLEEEVHQ